MPRNQSEQGNKMNSKETLTPRERILKAINHQQPDRVPIDLGGFQTGILAVPKSAASDSL
jgi:hypothetical protein